MQELPATENCEGDVQELPATENCEGDVQHNVVNHMGDTAEQNVPQKSGKPSISQTAGQRKNEVS